MMYRQPLGVMIDDLLCATVSARGVIPDTTERVLLVQRRTDGNWELPGGRLSRGEAPGAGLRREINEETGLSVTIVDVLKANSWVNSAGEDRFAVHYRCEPTDEPVELSDEHVDSEWVRPKKVEQVLCDSQIDAVQITMAETDGTSEKTTNPSATQD
jgi:8-oxo-dGTP pyrophosphatase MutT (NUDIX family)